MCMNNDIQSLKRYDAINKTIGEGFRALNINLSDHAESLRKLNKFLTEMNRKYQADDYWHPVFGEDGGFPGPEFDWVLVRIRDAGTNNKPYSVPHIAEVRNGEWWAQEWDDRYGSEKVPFEVVFWKPIPGDESVDIVSNCGKVIEQRHIYGY